MDYRSPKAVTTVTATVTTVSVFIYVALTSVGVADARLRAIELPQSVQDCYDQVDRRDGGDFVQSTFSWTCESVLGRSIGAETTKVLDKSQANYFKHLAEQIATDDFKGASASAKSRHGGTKSRGKRSHGARPPCVRREYRLLSDDERERFHAAIRALKEDTSVTPNKYDSLAFLHTGLGVKKAHDGAGFPGWHRIYIFMFETALREVEPSICLPYWDSTLDAAMDDPSSSQVWSNDFFGTPQGPVLEGPFANFKTVKGTPVTRNVGDDGELFSHSALDDILSRSRYEEILSSGGSRPRYRLEHHHNAVHVFIGGTMDKLDGSAYDPIFWMHHAYIDFVWERFREKLRRAGRDPEEYPRVRASSRRSRHHEPSAQTGIVDGLTQDTGYKNILSALFRYEDPPTCPDCRSRYLRCEPTTGKCVPITIAEMNNLPGRRSSRPRRSANGTETRATPSCTKSSQGDISVTQNDFCADDVCDVSQWVALPVQVVSVRPPRVSSYHSYPVQDGRINTSSDIYSTENISSSDIRREKQNRQKVFNRCASDHAVGKVFLTSRGINYDGSHKETVIVDNRLPVSVSMGHTFVKKPRLGFPDTTVLLRAHDSCGRVCQPYCRQGGVARPCSGAVAVDTQVPRMFSHNPDEAVRSVFATVPGVDVPEFSPDRFFLTFYCDSRQNFPFLKTTPKTSSDFTDTDTRGDHDTPVARMRVDGALNMK